MAQEIKTGTTCIGMKFKDGVLLAADRRVTSYKINSDKFVKVFELSPSIVTTVSGGVADAQRFVRSIQGELKLLSLKYERPVYTREAAMLLTDYQYVTMRQQGGIVGMLLGGYDEKEGFLLYELSPEGSLLDCEDYVTSGSGSIFVDSILASEHSKNMSEKEALALVEKAFKMSFKHDNASGGGYIVKVIKNTGIEQVDSKVVETQLVKEK